jgi:hypothetical protein
VGERALIDDVRSVARDIVLDRVEPYRGAAAIWARMAEEDEDYPEALRVFVGLASEWQDHPEHRAALDADIREEAQRVIESASANDG